MKNKILIISLILGFFSYANAAQENTSQANTSQTNPSQTNPPMEQEFNSLGGNEIFIEKAKLLEPEQEISVVQQRSVNRIKKSEFDFDYNSFIGGDPYVNSRSFGLGYQFHITPRWSVGARYSYFFNDLTSEAKNLINNSSVIPQVDFPKQQYMAVLNWYPVYGKFNLYDMQIVHFDIYLLGGYGLVELQSGNTGTYTAGGGLAFWWNRHWSSRIEASYQYYQANSYKGAEDRNLTDLTFMMGYLL